ncbi:ribosomal protein L31 [Oxalobacteraceae bacterium GrIS 2.11]
MYTRRFGYSGSRFQSQVSDTQSGQEARRPTKWLLAAKLYLEAIMKKGIHPNYREVVIQDMSIDFKFITRSTINTRDTIEFEGKTYPLVKIEVSAESHPFYTGKHKIVDTAGRVDKFRKKFGTVGSKTAKADE